MWTGALSWWKCYWLIWRVLASSDGISSWTPLKPQHSNPNPNPKMCSNNIVNFQESTTILNACTKKVWKLIEYAMYIYIYIYIYISIKVSLSIYNLDHKLEEKDLLIFVGSGSLELFHTGAHRIMVIIIGNGHGQPSLNSGILVGWFDFLPIQLLGYFMLKMFFILFLY